MLCNEGKKLVIGGKPIDRVKFIGPKPAGGLVLVEMERLREEGTHIAVHSEMELGIVPFNGCKIFVNADFRIQFLTDLPHKGLLRALPFLNLTSRQFPPVLPVSIAPLGGKNPVTLTYDCRYNFNPFHTGKYTAKIPYLCTVMAESNFIDYVRIFCASGHGGAGSAHLHRAKYVPKGGPDGGDGGRGGHIILRVNPQLWTLIHLRYRKVVRADNGGNGAEALKRGKNGADIVLEVPQGVVVKDAETEEVITELVEPGQEYILCQGGKGGWGNDHFKSATNQTPRYAQPGEDGQEGWFILELKVLADVGLVGFPNAGKSTLLSVITSAKPKIANYAFTTLEPNLGIVRYYDDRSFVMADIPGIIEGAHEGKGIGMRFLRHIERNSVLLFMVAADEPDVMKGYKILLNELEEYNPELLVKDRVLAITKMDLIDDKQKAKIEKKIPADLPHVFISSVAHLGLEELKEELWKALNK